MWFLKLIRFHNLLIMGAIQTVIFYQINLKSLIRGQIYPESPLLIFAIIITGTIIIGATGNIWNDYNDLQIDRINRPQKVYIDNQIKSKHASLLVAIIAIVGILCALLLTFITGNLWILALFICSTVMLYFYSTTWKKKPLVGNIAVSFLCSLVVGLTALLLIDEFKKLASQDQVVFRNWSLSFGAFCCFAFLGTFSREMIKDLEDYKGDSLLGLQTYPISTSIPRSKNLIRLNNVFLFILITVCSMVLWPKLSLTGIIYMATLLLFLSLLQYLLLKAENSSDYHRLSTYWKYFFLFGMGFAFITPI